MLSVSKLSASANACMGWPYVSPGTNDQNGIDCSGLFVKMYRDQGAKIYHGSNTIYHDYCSKAGTLTSISQLQPGMAVFKLKAWTDADQGDKWYGEDPGNLSHIGYVDSVNPLRIIHASSASGCVTVDTKIGKWACWGRLKDVDYGGSPSPELVPEPVPEPVPAAKTMFVYAENGKPVNLRTRASKHATLVDRVPVGAAVIWQKDNGASWAYVKYHGKSGWMMDCFLRENEPGSASDLEPASILYNVQSENGKPVRMRAEPNTGCNLYDEVPSGSKVEMLVYNYSIDKKGNQWSKISYGHRKGWYMMSKFLSVG